MLRVLTDEGAACVPPHPPPPRRGGGGKKRTGYSVSLPPCGAGLGWGVASENARRQLDAEQDLEEVPDGGHADRRTEARAPPREPADDHRDRGREHAERRQGPQLLEEHRYQEQSHVSEHDVAMPKLCRRLGIAPRQTTAGDDQAERLGGERQAEDQREEAPPPQPDPPPPHRHPLPAQEPTHPAH